MTVNMKDMTTATLLILVGIGVLTGFFAGMLGIGGAIIMVPALVFILGLTQQNAQGTSIAVMLPPIGIIAALNYYKQGQVNLKFALILAVFFIAGSYFGSKFALSVPENMLKKIFGVLLLAVALKMLLSK
ncbi:MAG TPA: sulfite exporter TauE/SafE family protein [Bacteroidales bacterium]|jgi:uncharacterized membrane protein YfcA|nr:sulfite exporter TauE/SafE family protein [Bacteroidales bacterium]